MIVDMGHYLAVGEANCGQQPSGSGAFRFVSWEPGARVVPQAIHDERARALALLTGEIDMAVSAFTAAVSNGALRWQNEGLPAETEMWTTGSGIRTGEVGYLRNRPLFHVQRNIGVKETVQDLVRTARATGLPGWVVGYKHALRNSAIASSPPSASTSATCSPGR